MFIKKTIDISRFFSFLYISLYFEIIKLSYLLIEWQSINKTYTHFLILICQKVFHRKFWKCV